MILQMTTPALIFPAISLIMLAYTNRFLGLSSVIRSLTHEYQQHPDDALLLQIDNLQQQWLIGMQLVFVREVAYHAGQTQKTVGIGQHD